jgi:hypothetical protein
MMCAYLNVSACLSSICVGVATYRVPTYRVGRDIIHTADIRPQTVGERQGEGVWEKGESYFFCKSTQVFGFSPDVESQISTQQKRHQDSKGERDATQLKKTERDGRREKFKEVTFRRREERDEDFCFLDPFFNILQHPPRIIHITPTGHYILFYHDRNTI